jgi:hypothetical protein
MLVRAVFLLFINTGAYIMQDQEFDRDIFNDLFSMPRRGAAGFIKGLLVSSTFLGAVDMLGIINLSEWDKLFIRKLYLGFALIGYGLGVQHEEPIPTFPRRLEASFNPLQRVGLFMRRAVATRAPQTVGEGLAKSFILSNATMMFADEYLSVKNGIKLFAILSSLLGAWGYLNQNNVVFRR